MIGSAVALAGVALLFVQEVRAARRGAARRPDRARLHPRAR